MQMYKISENFNNVPIRPIIRVEENKPHLLLYNGNPVSFEINGPFDTRYHQKITSINTVSIEPLKQYPAKLPYQIKVGIPYYKLTIHNRLDEQNPNECIFNSDKAFLPSRIMNLKSYKKYIFYFK